MLMRREGYESYTSYIFSKARSTIKIIGKIQYLRDNITFVCIPVDNAGERLRLKEGIIASLNKHPSFGSSGNWLGLNSPIPEIASSGLWNRQGLQGQTLSDDEIERIKWLVRFGNNNINTGRARVQRAENSARVTIETSVLDRATTEDIRLHIEKLMQEAKSRGEDFIDLVSGDIHKKLNMKNRMPQVCGVMYKEMMPGDEVLHTTPSGYSSTIKIRYDLRNR